MENDGTASSPPVTRLEVIYQDEDYVAIDKPSGLLVHRSELAREEGANNCLAILRNQLGTWLYPVHRLDRGTSGVLVFALKSDAASSLASRWREQGVRKTYHAICRGWVEAPGEVDRPLAENPDKPRVPARTLYRPLRKVEFGDAVGRYPTTRYSWIEVEPLTGRFHQIRKHLASVSHPLIGDVVYGEGKHNRYFREKFGISRLLLCARTVEFAHPRTGEAVRIEAGIPAEFEKVFGQGQG